MRKMTPLSACLLIRKAQQREEERIKEGQHKYSINNSEGVAKQ
jgi:hypothetical protein